MFEEKNIPFPEHSIMCLDNNTMQILEVNDSHTLVNYTLDIYYIVMDGVKIASRG